MEALPSPERLLDTQKLMLLFRLSQKSIAFLINPREILLCLIVPNHDTRPHLPPGVLVEGLVSPWALPEMKIVEDDPEENGGVGVT